MTKISRDSLEVQKPLFSLRLGVLHLGGDDLGKFEGGPRGGLSIRDPLALIFEFFDAAPELGALVFGGPKMLVDESDVEVKAFNFVFRGSDESALGSAGSRDPPPTAIFVCISVISST